eukprot:890439_1
MSLLLLVYRSLVWTHTWTYSIMTTYFYAIRHKYQYFLLRPSKSCIHKNCASYDPNVSVHPSWMKIKSILVMLNERMKPNDIGVYLDSDVILNKKYFNMSIDKIQIICADY